MRDQAQGTPLQSNVVSRLIAAMQTELLTSQLGLINALSHIKHPDATAFVLSLAIDTHQDRDVRLTALSGLGQTQDRSLVPALIGLLDDPDRYLASFAAESLGKIGDSRAVLPLVDSLENLRTWDRKASQAASALSQLGTGPAEDALIRLLNSAAAEARRGAVPMVVYLFGERSAPHLLARVHDAVPEIQTEAAAWFEMVVDSSMRPEAPTAYVESDQREAVVTAVKQAWDKANESVRASQWRTAIGWFQNARTLAPSDWRILYNLGLACEREGGREFEAIAWYNAALAAGADRAGKGRDIQAATKSLQREIVADIVQLTSEAYHFRGATTTQAYNQFHKDLEPIGKLLQYWQAVDEHGQNRESAFSSMLLDSLKHILPATPTTDAMVTGHGLLPRRGTYLNGNLPLTNDIFSIAKQGNVAEALVDVANYRPYQQNIDEMPAWIDRQIFAFYRIALACVSNDQPKMAVWVAEHMDYFCRSHNGLSLGRYKEVASLRAHVYRQLIKQTAESSSGHRSLRIAFWSNIAMSYRPVSLDKGSREPQWEFSIRRARTKAFRLTTLIRDMTDLAAD